MLRLTFILGLLLLLLIGAYAWSGSTRLPQADFTFVTRGEIGTLDPNRMSWLQDIRIGYGLWEGLYALDPQTLDPIPGVAQTIEVSPDKTRYRFHLRPDARWSNGDPVTAQDFLFAWRRMLEEPGDYTYLFHEIRGAEAYQDAFAKHQPADFDAVGAHALDARTLDVELTHPVTYFPDLCAFAPFWPLHEPSMRPFYDPATRSYSKAFTRPPALVSNGPFYLAAWAFKRELRLQANPFYWDRANVKLRNVSMLNADDEMWCFLKYDSGQADWYAEATGTIGAELYKQKRPDLHTCTAFGTYFYSLNCLPRLPDGRVNPLADVRVRMALSLAINRQPIVDTVTRMGEPVASHYIPPGVFKGYNSPPGPRFDPVRARQLLAEAGYPGGRGFPEIAIMYNSESAHSEVAQTVHRQWLENLGLNIPATPLEIKTFRQRLHAKDYTIARASWFGDYNDPSTFTDKYRSNSENNDAGWVSLQYDHLLDQAAIEPDPAKRLRLFEQAEAILLQEQPIIPVYHYINAGLNRPNVKGIPMNPRNMVILKGISKEAPAH